METIQLSTLVFGNRFTFNFNYGEFAIIKSQVGLNSHKLSVKEWVKNQCSSDDSAVWVPAVALLRIPA